MLKINFMILSAFNSHMYAHVHAHQPTLFASELGCYCFLLLPNACINLFAKEIYDKLRSQSIRRVKERLKAYF